MEKLSEKQTPDFVEMRKTLVGLGNVLIQAGLADSISCLYYSVIEDFSFTCADFKYEVNAAQSYDESAYLSFVDEIKSYLKEVVNDYEKQILDLECSKAVIEIYLSEKK